MKKIGFISVVVLMILFNANIAFAGFGISPPKVLNHQLLPGSHFEQIVYLVQSKPEKELLAKVEIDAPEIKEWINIDRGLEFIIPAGIQQFPIKISVDVPTDAEFKNYGGEIWIKTTPKEKGEGMVTVAYGGIISFDLKVSTEETFGFVVRGLDIGNIEEGRPIKIGINLQNVGNVADRPTKVYLAVFDQYHSKMLYSGENTKLDEIKPFETKTILSKFSAELEIGYYWADVTVYKDDKVLIEDKRVFYVIERTGIFYKIFSHWYSWVILGVLILIGAALKFKKQLKVFIKNCKNKRIELKKIKLEQKLEKLKKE